MEILGAEADVYTALYCVPRLAALMPAKMQKCGVGSLGELTVRGRHSGGWCWSQA